jgi:predicted transcriptional regulator
MTAMEILQRRMATLPPAVAHAPAPETLARKKDPATSHAAAFKVEKFRVSQERKILHALTELGPSAANEIGAFTALRVDQVDRRVAEMIRRGLVRRLEQTRGGYSVLERCE